MCVCVCGGVCVCLCVRVCVCGCVSLGSLNCLFCTGGHAMITQQDARRSKETANSVPVLDLSNAFSPLLVISRLFVESGAGFNTVDVLATVFLRMSCPSRA